MIPCLVPIPGASGRFASFRGAHTSTSNASSFDFMSVDLGPPDPTRCIVVGVTYYEFDTSVNLNSISVAGTGLTSRRTIQYGVPGGSGSFIYANISNALITAGATGTVSLSFSRSIDRGCSIGVWALYNLNSIVPVDTASDGSSGTATLSLVPQSGDLVVAVAAGNNSAGSFTWGSMTERYDTAPNALARSGADAISPSASFSPTVEYSAGQVAAAAAAWR